MRGSKRGGDKVHALRVEMNDTMESGCGVYRDQESMHATVEKMTEIRGRLDKVDLHDSSKVFNTELISALELANMVEIAQALAISAAHRKESRGAHTCRDFPTRDDSNYLYHTMAYREDTGARLGKKDVALGHWVPEERKY